MSRLAAMPVQPRMPQSGSLKLESTLHDSALETTGSPVRTARLSIRPSPRVIAHHRSDREAHGLCRLGRAVGPHKSLTARLTKRCCQFVERQHQRVATRLNYTAEPEAIDHPCCKLYNSTQR
jgi:hypothetical protein